MTGQTPALPPKLDLNKQRAVQIAKLRSGSASKATGKSKLSNIGDFVEKGNEIFQRAQTAAFSVTGLMQNFIQGVTALYKFDWASTDEKLNKQIEESLKQLAIMSAGSFGQMLGWAVCGGLGGQVLTKFDSAMAATLCRTYKFKNADPSKKLSETATEELNEEMLEEMAGAYAALLMQAHKVSQQIAFTKLFMGVRSLMKMSGLADKLFGSEFAKKWGESELPPITMAGFVEEQIKKIPDETVKRMVEQGLENFLESCQEALMLTASGMDSWIAYQKAAANNNVLGKQRKVKVIFVSQDNQAKESVVITGGEEILKPAIAQTIAQHQLIGNRSVGTVITRPVNEGSHSRLPRDIELRIEFSSFKSPYGNTGKAAAKAAYKIACSRSKLDWNLIKQAAGGSNGYMYGPCRVTWFVSDGGQYPVFGASKSECEQRLEAFLALSNLEMISATSGEEEEGGRRKKANGNMKERVRVYPHWVTVTWFKRTTSITEGRQFLNRDSRGELRSKKIALWHDKQPKDWEILLAEMTGSQ